MQVVIRSLAAAAVLAGCLALPSTTEAGQEMRPAEPTIDAVPALPPPPNHLTLTTPPVTQPKRPGALVPLYGTFAGLQGLDMHSTRRALDAGAHEANPLMRRAVERDTSMIAMKSAGTAAAIWATERMWKKHRRAAVLTALALNIASAAVVAHNYRVVR